jgi:hypothetical protein
MWPFKKKTPAPLEPADVVVYVRNDEIPMDANDVMTIAMSLVSNVNIWWGVTPPDFPYITERQYQALPQHCHPYFEPRRVSLPRYDI